MYIDNLKSPAEISGNSERPKHASYIFRKRDRTDHSPTILEGFSTNTSRFSGVGRCSRQVDNVPHSVAGGDGNGKEFLTSRRDVREKKRGRIYSVLETVVENDEGRGERKRGGEERKKR